MTEHEKAAFEKRARDNGLSVSSWLRFIGSSAIIRSHSRTPPLSVGATIQHGDPNWCVQCGGYPGPICSDACSAAFCEAEGIEQEKDAGIVAEAGKQALEQMRRQK